MHSPLRLRYRSPLKMYISQKETSIDQPLVNRYSNIISFLNHVFHRKILKFKQQSVDKVQINKKNDGKINVII
jgi:hypothetical protein